MADRPPEHVYVVCVTSEWPIDVISGEPETHAASGVEMVVKRRLESGNVTGREQIKVFKARLTDIEEVELMPTTTVRAALRPKSVDARSRS